MARRRNRLCWRPLGCGTVFKLTPPAAGQTKWTKEILYRFQGGSDGEAPVAPLVLDSKGALYGTTLAGGGTFGPGTVFKLTPPAAGQTQWTETILYRFTGAGGDGDGPEAGLISLPAKPIARSTTTRLCGCAGGCDPSTRSGDVRAGAIHSRTYTGTSGSYA